MKHPTWSSACANGKKRNTASAKRKSVKHGLCIATVGASLCVLSIGYTAEPITVHTHELQKAIPLDLKKCRTPDRTQVPKSKTSNLNTEFQPWLLSANASFDLLLGRNTKEASSQAGHTRRQNPKKRSRANLLIVILSPKLPRANVLRRNSRSKNHDLSWNDWTIPNCVGSQIQPATKAWSTSKSSQIIPVLIQTWIIRVLYTQERVDD